eukprot:COSAG06_NODE_23817_length_680_cov_2.447504_1_plen_42_part_10
MQPPQHQVPTPIKLSEPEPEPEVVAKDVHVAFREVGAARERA